MSETDQDILLVRLFVRWYRIRKARPELVPALLQDPAHGIFTFSNPMDPWGSKVRLKVCDLEALVNLAEALMRKPVASETAPDSRAAMLA